MKRKRRLILSHSQCCYRADEKDNLALNENASTFFTSLLNLKQPTGQHHYFPRLMASNTVKLFLFHSLFHVLCFLILLKLSICIGEDYVPPDTSVFASLECPPSFLPLVYYFFPYAISVFDAAFHIMASSEIT